LVEGVSNPDAVIQHFRSTLAYLHSRKETTIMNDGASEVARNFGEIDLVGSLLKMGLQ
jgi:vacuolar protein sorting-associated protein 35